MLKKKKVFCFYPDFLLLQPAIWDSHLFHRVRTVFEKSAWINQEHLQVPKTLLQKKVSHVIFFLINVWVVCTSGFCRWNNRRLLHKKIKRTICTFFFTLFSMFQKPLEGTAFNDSTEKCIKGESQEKRKCGLYCSAVLFVLFGLSFEENPYLPCNASWGLTVGLKM